MIPLLLETPLPRPARGPFCIDVEANHVDGTAVDDA
jgi:hypothetical protein